MWALEEDPSGTQKVEEGNRTEEQLLTKCTRSARAKVLGRGNTRLNQYLQDIRDGVWQTQTEEVAG